MKKLFEEIKKTAKYGPVEIITGLSGICVISPPGEMLHPDAEPGEPGYGERSQCWALLPEGGSWVQEYDTLEALLQAEGQDFIALT